MSKRCAWARNPLAVVYHDREWGVPVRNEVGIATMTVGAVTTPDQVNTLLAAGKADLVALARPHLANPYFTLQASAWYQHLGQYWPPQYLSGRDQALRNAARERAELSDVKLRARPASHEVKGTDLIYASSLRK